MRTCAPLSKSATLLLSLALPDVTPAGISYSQAGSVYSENFDSLPIVFSGNSNIQTLYPSGWIDDSPGEENVSIGVPGWYLYHPVVPTSGTPVETGFNGHQRMRFGPGANTGGFWAFGLSADDPEKALGSVGSTTVAANGAPLYRALRLVNETGVVLTQFTLTFDGEQWRDGQSTDPETQTCAYSFTATETNWFDVAEFTEVPELNFQAPVFEGTGSSGASVDGSFEGNVPGITATISGIAWAPLGELWIRWNDPQLASNADDGLAIDNVRFTAIASTTTPPVEIPPARLAIGQTEAGEWQLQWQGAAGISTFVQHSGDLTEWITETTAIPETAAPQTWTIPAALTAQGRYCFRLRRTVIQPG